MIEYRARIDLLRLRVGVPPALAQSLMEAAQLAPQRLRVHRTGTFPFPFG